MISDISLGFIDSGISFSTTKIYINESDTIRISEGNIRIHTVKPLYSEASQSQWGRASRFSILSADSLSFFVVRSLILDPQPDGVLINKQSDLVYAL